MTQAGTDADRDLALSLVSPLVVAVDKLVQLRRQR